MRKYFKHEFITFPHEELEEKIVPNEGRYYKLPSGVWVKSVTTIIGEKTDKTFLEKWKERVGIEEANKISRIASIRGKIFHAIAESYLLNCDNYPKGITPLHIESFKQIRPYLAANVNSVLGLESSLYSETLKTAGRTDLLCKWNGIETVVDFKTSLKPKKEEWIENYFIQATCYSMMIEELTGIHIPQFVILIANDEDCIGQCFIKKTDSYREKVLEIFA